MWLDTHRFVWCNGSGLSVLYLRFVITSVVGGSYSDAMPPSSELGLALNSDTFARELRTLFLDQNGPEGPARLM